MAKTHVLSVVLLLQACIILGDEVKSACSSCSNEALRIEKRGAIETEDPDTDTEWNGTIVVKVEHKSRSANFTWDVTPELPEGQDVYVREERKYSWCPQKDFVGEWKKKKKSTDHIFLYLRPSVKTIVTVKVGHVTESANITSPAKLPGRKLENLTCTEWSCEVAVDHDCSLDNGPNIYVKFVLEEWNKTHQSFSPVKTVDRNITKNFTAKVLWRDFDLRPFTNYSLKAYPANSKGKRKNKLISENFTTPEALPNVTNLVGRLLEEENQIQLSWKLSDDYFLRQGVHYFVLLCNDNCEDMPYTTNTTMTISYEGRPVATKYTAEIKACIPKRLCSGKAEIELWTPPEWPDILENTTDAHPLPEPTANTITIRLPVLLNPPGWHWVLLKKSEDKRSKAWNESLREMALEKVRQKNKNESSLSFDRNSTIETDFRIVKRVSQDKEDEEKGETNQVTVGKRHPLQSNTKYTVVVVVETRAGCCTSRYYASPPKLYWTKPDVEPVNASLMIVGICTAAVLLAVLATAVWIKFCQRRGRRSSVAPNQLVSPPAAVTSF